MYLKKRGKKSNVPVSIIAFFCAILSVICFCIRLPSVLKDKNDNVKLFAAGFILPDGEKKSIQTQPLHKTTTPLDSSSLALSEAEESSSSPETISEETHEGENKYKVIESQFAETGTKYENFYVKNSINYNLNIAEELSKRPDVNIKKDGSPQVLIVHTHTSEAYMESDCGFYYESFYARSTDYDKNVTRVGNAIAEKLKQNGIGVVHDLTYHDSPSYNGSYSRAAETIKKNLAENPSIQVVLDIHRDAIGNNESGKVKPTFKINNQKAAQTMIICGCDDQNIMNFPDWEYNLRLGLRLQQTAETMYPGMTRALNFSDVKYNMHLTHGSLLIEVGSEMNTLQEAVRSGEFLGNALSDVLNKLVV